MGAKICLAFSFWINFLACCEISQIDRTLDYFFAFNILIKRYIPTQKAFIISWVLEPF